MQRHADATSKMISRSSKLEVGRGQDAGRYGMMKRQFARIGEYIVRDAFDAAV
jgi:hypothetical protein